MFSSAIYHHTVIDKRNAAHHHPHLTPKNYSNFPPLSPLSFKKNTIFARYIIPHCAGHRKIGYNILT